MFTKTEAPAKATRLSEQQFDAAVFLLARRCPRLGYAGSGRLSLGLDCAPVVSIVGDGAALYSPQALWTAAREKLPVTFVVVNNREYNILKNS